MPTIAPENAIPEAENSDLEVYVPYLANRSAEEIEETRRRIFAMSPEPRALPPGKTLEDVIVGHWPGDETDEQIREALEELS